MAPPSSDQQDSQEPQGIAYPSSRPEDAGDAVDEEFPLLLPERDGDAGVVDDQQMTKGVWHLVLLTIGIGGLQIAWSVELSNGSPYLLSLGLSKSLMALVWIAGPLTGTLVQPYIGMLSDGCRISWGRRKPFMLAGAAATVASLLFLAWAREIVGGILGLFGADPASHGVAVAIIVAAVVGIYVLDFAINTVQASLRAFIVDCAPAHQQEAANAMASRLTGVGNITGYIAGYVDLRPSLWFLGDSQFKILCALASVALTATVCLSAATIRERDPREDPLPHPDSRPGVLSFLTAVARSVRRLPPQIRRVCQVQFFAWIGFFPLLFYTSSYIGEIYVEPYLRENPHMTPDELDRLYEEATRIGTFALLVNSIVSLLTNVFLPFFIAPTYDSAPVSAAGKLDDDDESSQKPLLSRLRIPGFTLRRAWLGSLILFSVSMFCTLLVRSVRAATALVGLVGITWAMTLWAPWAIISAEIGRRNAIARARNLREGYTDGGSEETEHGVDQAGVILGIHNMAIAAPQIIATVGSSIVFKILQKPRGTPGDHSMAVVMALGGACVLFSSLFVARISDDPSADDGEVLGQDDA